MHIIIGLLTSIAGLVWALHSLQQAGFDFDMLNPFTWFRRRNWQRKLGIKPMHALTESIDAVGLLIVSIATQQGAITRETKLEILKVFESDLGLSRAEAIDMFSSSTFMLKDVMDMAAEVKHVLEPSKKSFSSTQIEKLLNLLDQIAKLEHDPSDAQLNIINAVAHVFQASNKESANW